MRYVLVWVIVAIAAIGCGFDDGKDGSSCSVETVQGGAVISCTDGSGSLITSGVDGLDGGDAFIELIDPCGDGPGFDEVLLRLTDGRLVAYFEQGGNRFLSVISDGNYRTTDAQGCYFSVSGGNVLD